MHTSAAQLSMALLRVNIHRSRHKRERARNIIMLQSCLSMSTSVRKEAAWCRTSFRRSECNVLSEVAQVGYKSTGIFRSIEGLSILKGWIRLSLSLIDRQNGQHGTITIQPGAYGRHWLCMPSARWKHLPSQTVGVSRARWNRIKQGTRVKVQY
jgi:hypothetical protein